MLRSVLALRFNFCAFSAAVRIVTTNIMAHMPSAYVLSKKTIFNKVQYSSVEF